MIHPNMKLIITVTTVDKHTNEILENIIYQLKQFDNVNVEIFQGTKQIEPSKKEGKFHKEDMKLLNRLINLQREEIKHLREKVKLQGDKIRAINDEKRIKEVKIRKSELTIRNLVSETLHILYKIMEFKDYETHMHTVRVGLLSKLLAENLGMERKFVTELELAAPFHDIGKLVIPDSILLKPGKLENEEFEIMKKHTIHGYEFLKDYSASVIKLAAEISLTHHERWDGSGYPIGLKGEEIPISGQIVGVADSFDAMISKRPYKRAKSFDEAFREIEENSGTLYSPQVVKAFLESVEEVISIYRGDKYNNNFNDNFEKN